MRAREEMIHTMYMGGCPNEGVACKGGRCARCERLPQQRGSLFVYVFIVLVSIINATVLLSLLLMQLKSGICSLYAYQVTLGSSHCPRSTSWHTTQSRLNYDNCTKFNKAWPWRRSCAFALVHWGGLFDVPCTASASVHWQALETAPSSLWSSRKTAAHQLVERENTVAV